MSGYPSDEELAKALAEESEEEEEVANDPIISEEGANDPLINKEERDSRDPKLFIFRMVSTLRPEDFVDDAFLQQIAEMSGDELNKVLLNINKDLMQSGTRAKIVKEKLKEMNFGTVKKTKDDDEGDNSFTIEITYEGISFKVVISPTDTIKGIREKWLQQHQKVLKGKMGLTKQKLKEELSYYFGQEEMGKNYRREASSWRLVNGSSIVATNSSSSTSSTSGAKSKAMPKKKGEKNDK